MWPRWVRSQALTQIQAIFGASAMNGTTWQEIPILLYTHDFFSVKPALKLPCWQEAMVIGDLGGYTPPSDPGILDIFVLDICLDFPTVGWSPKSLTA